MLFVHKYAFVRVFFVCLFFFFLLICFVFCLLFVFGLLQPSFLKVVVIKLGLVIV